MGLSNDIKKIVNDIDSFVKRANMRLDKGIPSAIKCIKIRIIISTVIVALVSVGACVIFFI